MIYLGLDQTVLSLERKLVKVSEIPGERQLLSSEFRILPDTSTSAGRGVRDGSTQESPQGLSGGMGNPDQQAPWLLFDAVQLPGSVRARQR